MMLQSSKFLGGIEMEKELNTKEEETELKEIEYLLSCVSVECGW